MTTTFSQIKTENNHKLQTTNSWHKKHIPNNFVHDYDAWNYKTQTGIAQSHPSNIFTKSNATR